MRAAGSATRVSLRRTGTADGPDLSQNRPRRAPSGPGGDTLVWPGLYHRADPGLALYGLAGGTETLQRPQQPADRERPGRFPVLGHGRRADRRTAGHRAVLSAELLFLQPAGHPAGM